MENPKKSQNSREKKIIAAVMVFPVDLGTQAVWTLAAPPATTCSSPPLPYTRVKHLFKPWDYRKFKSGTLLRINITEIIQLNLFRCKIK